MKLRTVSLVSGVLGGLAWVARYVLDLAETTDDSLVDALYWGGGVLLVLALLGFGTSLVSKSATWLRMIVAVAFPLLVWSVLEVLGESDEALVDGGFGAVMVVVSVVALTRASPEQPRRHAGSHAR